VVVMNEYIDIEDIEDTV